MLGISAHQCAGESFSVPEAALLRIEMSMILVRLQDKCFNVGTGDRAIVDSFGNRVTANDKIVI